MDAGGQARHVRLVDPAGAVVDGDLQVGHEPPGLRRPVAHHRGRGDDQRRPLGHAVGDGLVDVGQHGRRLAQAHVQRQAPAQPGVLEEPQPSEGLGLVGPQRPAEPVRLGASGVVQPLGAADQIGGPAVARDGDPPGQRGALQAEGMPQHVGAGQPGLVGPLGQRLGRLHQIGPLDLDPLAPALHQRAGLRGQAADLVRGEIDVVEDHRPADVGELGGAHHRVLGLQRGEAQRRPGPAAGQRRHPDVVAAGGEHQAFLGHERPGLVLAQHHLAPAPPAQPQQLGVEPLQPGELVAHRVPAGGRGVDQGRLDRLQLPGAGDRQHRQVPGAALVRRVELDHQAPVVGAGHRARPLVEPAGQLGPVPAGDLEGLAVEVGQHGLGRVGPGGGLRRRGGHVEPLDGLADDGIHQVGQRGLGEGDPVPLVLEGGGRSGQRVGQGGQGLGLHQGRRPADGEAPGVAAGGTVTGGAVAVVAACVAAAELLELGDEAALGGEPHGQGGDQAQPGHARADPLLAGRVAQRHQPAEAALDRGRDSLGPVAAPELDRPVQRPLHGGAPAVVEAGPHPLGALGRRSVAGGPGDDPAGDPRELQFRHPGLGRPVLGAAAERGPGRADQLGQHPVHRPVVGLQVGHDDRPLMAADGGPHVVDRLGHVVEQAVQSSGPNLPVGFEQLQLIGCGPAVHVAAHEFGEVFRQGQVRVQGGG